MTRKVIQIATSVWRYPKGSYDPSVITLYALCDDGSMWHTIGESPDQGQGWRHIQNIPMPMEKAR